MKNIDALAAARIPGATFRDLMTLAMDIDERLLKGRQVDERNPLAVLEQEWVIKQPAGAEES